MGVLGYFFASVFWKQLLLISDGSFPAVFPALWCSRSHLLFAFLIPFIRATFEIIPESCSWNWCQIWLITCVLITGRNIKFSLKNVRKTLHCFSLHFPVIRSSSKILWCYPNLSLIQSHWDRLLSPYLPKLFSKLTGANSAPLTAITVNKKMREWVYLHCILPVWTNSNWCLVWDWNRWAYGTPSSAMQYSKRSYIIHLFFSVFGEPSSKCQRQTLLIWHACEAGVQNLDGLALQLLVGWVDIGMIMRHSFQKNGWINKQSSVWEE